MRHIDVAIDTGFLTTMTMSETAPARKNRKGVLRATGGFLGGLFGLLVKLALVLAFIAAGLLLGGFVQFATSVTQARAPAEAPQADAIVVLTGGSERIAVALDLLEQGKSDRLLISGVNPQTSEAALAEVHPDHARAIECCVDTERVSRDTIGNAIETRKWVAERGFESLVLVTSSYHMPRSLMEFSRQMRGIQVIAWPLQLTDLKRDDWWRNSTTLRLMVSEYVKYVGAWSRDYVQRETFDTVRASLFGSVGPSPSPSPGPSSGPSSGTTAD